MCFDSWLILTEWLQSTIAVYITGWMFFFGACFHGIMLSFCSAVDTQPVQCTNLEKNMIPGKYAPENSMIDCALCIYLATMYFDRSKMPGGR